jgi:hypothetical protein
VDFMGFQDVCQGQKTFKTKGIDGVRTGQKDDLQQD